MASTDSKKGSQSNCQNQAPLSFHSAPWRRLHLLENTLCMGYLPAPCRARPGRVATPVHASSGESTLLRVIAPPDATCCACVHTRYFEHHEISEFAASFSDCLMRRGFAGDTIFGGFFTALVNIASPSVACGIGVEERDLIAIAKCIGGQGCWHDGEVFIQGGVSCAE